MRLDRASLLFLVAAACVGTLLFWPLRHGHSYLDDFVFLALGQHLDSPWPLLYRDSLGAFFFRPIPMFAWWLTVAAFGTEAPAHLAFGIGLHVANGMALYVLLRVLALPRLPAALAGLLFIAHPATYSAAAWLSDRFDLFATLFGLLALIAVERYLLRPSRIPASLAAVAMLAALLSKETAFAFPLVAAAMLAWRIELSHAASSRQRWTLLIVLVACAVVALGMRPLVLRTVSDVMFLKDGIVATLFKGTLKWTQYLPDFFVVLQGGALSVFAWLAALFGILISALLPAVRMQLVNKRWLRVAAMGFLLTGATAAAQAPVVLASPIYPYTLEGRQLFEPLAASRFYYLPLVGLALVFAPLGAALQLSGPRSGRFSLAALVTVAMLIALVGMVASSRAIGRAWAQYPMTYGEGVIRQAVAGVLPLKDLKPGCKIYLLATPLSASAMLGMVDTAVKKSLPRGHPAVGCFIQSESAPWYHLLDSRGLTSGVEKPMDIILFGGKPFAPMPIENLTYYYLKLEDRPEVRSDPHAVFLAWDGAAFRDVSPDVRSGKRAVKFFDRRPTH